ncbi:MAG: response regulator [Desulfobulbaceae bacterium]|nr:response regulator [Desulfobulbaceae bacterium]HIJ79026.1 response regulator [Deltaproteobacteria bacterium]
MLSEKARILVVDDVPANIYVLEEVLDRNLYDIDVAMDGKTVLEKVQAEPRPDLILLDIQMPGMDGYEVCRRLKEDEGTCDIPVIFVTAKDREEDEEQGFAAGAVDYISKPFSVAVVLARVKTHVALKKSRDLIAALLEKTATDFEKSEQEYMKLYMRKLY